MATKEEVSASLQAFEKNCNSNERLQQMNRDWNRVIAVKATDIASEHTIVYHEGMAKVSEEPAKNPDITVISDSETLADLFYGDITPAEPYINGTLKVMGSEEDVMRLDFISLMIWGE